MTEKEREEIRKLRSPPREPLKHRLAHIQRCRYCYMQRQYHVEGTKCLFLPTEFEGLEGLWAETTESTGPG